MKIKTLTILGLVMAIALVATTFVVYSYAAPTQIHAADDMHEGDHGSTMHNELMDTMHGCTMHNSTMHNELMDDMHSSMMDNSTMHDELMDEMHGSTMTNSTIHNEADGSHHGCH